MTVRLEVEGILQEYWKGQPLTVLLLELTEIAQQSRPQAADLPDTEEDSGR